MNTYTGCTPQAHATRILRLVCAILLGWPCTGIAQSPKGLIEQVQILSQAVSNLTQRVQTLETARFGMDVIEFYVGVVAQGDKNPNPRQTWDEVENVAFYFFVPGPLEAPRTNHPTLAKNEQVFVKNAEKTAYECPGTIEEVVVVPTDEFRQLSTINTVRVYRDPAFPKRLRITGIVADQLVHGRDLLDTKFKLFVIYKPDASAKPGK